MTKENKDSNAHIHVATQTDIHLKRINREGYILDIGGGGEGVIGQLEGARVVAIDKRKDELEEANVGDYLRIVMDATELQFLNETFPTVTAFFSMLYMDSDTQRRVFEEVYRVLALEGEFWLWDMVIPKQFDETKQIYAIMLGIHLPEREFGTGYGCPWEKRKQDAAHFKKLGESVGFNLVDESLEEHHFFLRFKKN